MKDAFAAFGSEVYGPLVTQILPGFIAVSSWLQFFYQRLLPFQTFVKDYKSEAIIFGLLIALAVGHIIEDCGSQIEQVNWWRFKRKTAKRNRMERMPRRDLDVEWYAYLRIAFVVEPVGQHYLRGILLRMKFEQNAGVALILAGAGTFFLNPPVDWPWLGSVSLLFIGLYLMFKEARSSVELLANVRAQLLKEIRIVR